MIDKIAISFDIVSESVVAKQMLDFIRRKKPREVLIVRAASTSFRAIIALALAKKSDRPVLYVAQNEDDAGYLFQDLKALANSLYDVPDDAILFYPSLQGKALNEEGRKIMQNRVLERLQSQVKTFVVSYPEAVRQNVLNAEQLKTMTLKLKKNDTLDLNQLTLDFHELGLERVDFVFEPGQYAVRGSIVDVFSFSNESPFRLDFFGDTLDSIRSFDVSNQLSIEPLDECVIVGKVSSDSIQNAANLSAYLSPETVIFADEYEFVSAKLENDGITLDDFSIVDFSNRMAQDGEHFVDTKVKPSQLFNKNYQMLFGFLREKTLEGKQIFLATENARQRERLETMIAQLDKHGDVKFKFISGTLHRGFETDSFVLLLEHEIFGRYHRYSLTNRDTRRGREALTLRELKNLSLGDYVVHDDFGIGLFSGLVKTTKNGVEEEAVKITYKDGDILMVPLSALHKVSKYSGGDSAAVKVTKLGSARWETMKRNTKQKLKDISRELILLYAMRKKEQGHAFARDSFLQAELEGGFEFQDTPDQARATAEVKKDMESLRPMDRLVCGDVGFGKTEIAVRAALKAAADSKQVAVLVPTTVLAFQHYKTFSRRLQDLPVKVDYISRTRTASEVKAILKQLETGNIDILIGTHKLIGKGVKFKDLGLLIIDEEQKFGVSAKEKIKQMKVGVDTLTLTATPIPRTLQFSLLGARDLSVIQTPPEGRFPIETHLERFDENTIARAIEFELNRGGQVLFVNNNIKELDSLKALIMRVLPSVRVVIAHGRMTGEEIESNMLEFISGEYDVLLSTSIIESGIDIANCNTILINNAQNFGLSDLHQMRGRVGRSNVQAFCYLFSPPLECLSDEGRKRLEAITTYTELGSGLNIAMRDLDIRGAGNLLGAEQSGFIADLGFETYKKILAEAVQELKEGEFQHVYEEEEGDGNLASEILHTDCAMDTDFPCLLPENYVDSTVERLALYRELDAIKVEKDIEPFCTRLRDRFGAVPPETENLLNLIRLRFTANSLGFERLNLKGGKLVAFLTADRSSSYYQSEVFGRIIQYLGSHPHRCLLSENKAGKPYLQILDVSSIEEANEILKGIN